MDLEVPVEAGQGVVRDHVDGLTPSPFPVEEVPPVEPDGQGRLEEKFLRDAPHQCR